MLKLFKRCEYCKKRRFIVKRQKIILPTGDVAISQKDMCRQCALKVEKSLYGGK